MSRGTFRSAVVLSAVLVTSLAISGCGKKLEGKYQDSTGTTSVEFKGNKAYLNDAGVTREVDYDTDGDKITLRLDPAPVMLVYNRSNDTLSLGSQKTVLHKVGS